MKKKYLAIAVVAAQSLFPAVAEAQGLLNPQGRVQMDEMIQLPAGGISLVRSGKELLILSGNGRYMVRGTIYDMWNGGKPITTMQEARDTSSRIHITKMGLDLDLLMTFNYGKKKKDYVTAFVDISSEASKNLMDKLRPLFSKYYVKVVVVPALSKESAEASKQLACLRDASFEEASKMVRTWSFSFLPKGAPKKQCELGRLQRTLVTATLLGVQGFPTIIAPDGRTFKGVPEDLDLFLKGAARE